MSQHSSSQGIVTMKQTIEGIIYDTDDATWGGKVPCHVLKFSPFKEKHWVKVNLYLNHRLHGGKALNFMHAIDKDGLEYIELIGTLEAHLKFIKGWPPYEQCHETACGCKHLHECEDYVRKGRNIQIDQTMLGSNYKTLTLYRKYDGTYFIYFKDLKRGVFIITQVDLTNEDEASKLALLNKYINLIIFCENFNLKKMPNNEYKENKLAVFNKYIEVCIVP
jgi:hypothetical protein